MELQMLRRRVHLAAAGSASWQMQRHATRFPNFQGNCKQCSRTVVIPRSQGAAGS